MAVVFVPVRTNAATRPSRLMRSLPHYVGQSGATILRAYAMYQPLKVFSALGALITLVGALIGLRYLLFFFGRDPGHLQSVVLSAILVIVGFQVGLIGLIADLIAFNRKILEELLYRVRELETTESKPEPEIERS